MPAKRSLRNIYFKYLICCLYKWDVEGEWKVTGGMGKDLVSMFRVPGFSVGVWKFGSVEMWKYGMK